MKLKTPKPDTNFWIITGTLTFFVLSYFIYLEYYVPDQESKIISTRFRVLDQLGDNLNEKIKSYDNNVISLEDKIKDTVFSLKRRFEKVNIEVPEELIVEYVWKGLLKGHYRDFLNKDLEVSDYKLDLGATSGTPSKKIYQDDNKLDMKETDKYYYFSPREVATKSIVKGVKKTFYDSVLVRVSYENIMAGLNRQDVFDGLFIIRNGEFIYSTLNSDMLIDKSAQSQDIIDLLFTNPEPAAKEEEPGKSRTGPELSLQNYIISGQFSDITISNKDYKLFFKPIKIKGEYWFLGGLMEVGNFNIAGRSVPQRLIVILSMLLILLILGMPIIKLKVVSRTEQIKTKTIYSSALAVLFGATALTLFLIYISQNSLHLSASDKRLINLSGSINEAFTGEMTDAFNQITFLDQNWENFHFGALQAAQQKPIIPNILNQPVNGLAFPSIYPYADYLFWINDDGVQAAYLTPFREKAGDMTNVGKRDYFLKNDEWFFPSDSTRKFRLESILSITSGDHKVGMATPSIGTVNPVVALSSRFYSIIDPIIPKNYGFCIIDGQGKVWFHSNKNRNLMENFVNECNNNKKLNAALYNGTAASIKVTYYNKPHRLYITPLKEMPLYLVTFYNWENESSFQAQVFTMALFFIAMFFLMILLHVSVVLLLERIMHQKLSKNLILSLTRPMFHLGPRYSFLTGINLGVSLVTALFLTLLGKFHSYILICTVGLVLLTFAYRVLNDNDLKKKQVRWLFGINLSILFCIDLFMLFTTDILTAILVLAYQALLVITLVRGYEWFKKQDHLPVRKMNRAFINRYIMLLVSLTVSFGILPSLVCYEIAYNAESEIRLKHYQVDLMKQREARNDKWNSYYKPMLDSPASDSVLQERKNKGVYTRFLHNLAPSRAPFPPAASEDNRIVNSISDDLVMGLRPFYDAEINENKYLAYFSQKNSTDYWADYGNDSLVFKYLSNSENPGSQKQEYFRISGVVDVLNFLMPVHGREFGPWVKFIFNLVFWFMILLLMLIIFQLIRFSTRNIFSLGIISAYAPQSPADFIRSRLLVRKNVLFTSLSPGDTSQVLPEISDAGLSLDWSDLKVVEQSDALISKAVTKEKKAVTVVIRHFDYNYRNAELFREKLRLILKYIRSEETRMVIHSGENPDAITAFYQAAAGRPENQTRTDADPEQTSTVLYQDNLNDLQSVLSQITVNYLPVRCDAPGTSTVDPCSRQEFSDDLEMLVRSELSASDYLHRFDQAITTFCQNHIRGQNPENPEELVIGKILSMAEGYYKELFLSCTPAEQYVLYDFADDMIFNQKNSDVIMGLLEKGILVVTCDRISFMNVSFRRFVMAMRSKVDTGEFEIRIGKKAGTWQGFRIMFIMIIVSLIIFISMGNQDFLKNLNQIFVVLGGGIASFTAILSLLSKTGKSTSE